MSVNLQRRRLLSSLLKLYWIILTQQDINFIFKHNIYLKSSTLDWKGSYKQILPDKMCWDILLYFQYSSPVLSSFPQTYPLLLTGYKGLKPGCHSEAQLVYERWLVLGVDLNFDPCFKRRLICWQEEVRTFTMGMTICMHTLAWVI